MTERAPRAIALVGGLVFAGFGLWALVDPRAFYEAVATWPPFNRHLIHDIGAFQIGLGLVLLLALRIGDILLVALSAVAGGQVAHAVAHWMDKDLGGKPTDPYFMTALAAIFVAGAVLARRGGRKTSFRRR